MSIQQILSDIKSIDDIEGVTFTGGEPLLQAEELTKLAKLIRDETKLNIQIFTGYELTELQNTNQKEILKYTDIIVVGRFDQSKNNNNQKVHYLKNNQWEFNNSDIEIDIDEYGALTVTGYPSDNFIEELEGEIK